MKRIEYILPVDYVRGNISGRQSLTYDGGAGYSVPVNTAVSADNYQPRLVAQVQKIGTHNQRKIFQVRTRHTVNMTDAMRLNLATMGGAGGIYSAIVSDKTSQLYNDCVHACPDGYTLRGWLVPILRPALAAKESDIILADGLILSNPWNTGTGETVNIPQAVLDKFAGELGTE